MKNSKITRRFNVSLYKETEHALALLHVLLPELSEAEIVRIGIMIELGNFSEAQVKAANQSLRAARKAQKAAQS